MASGSVPPLKQNLEKQRRGEALLRCAGLPQLWVSAGVPGGSPWAAAEHLQSEDAKCEREVRVGSKSWQLTSTISIARAASSPCM